MNLTLLRASLCPPAPLLSTDVLRPELQMSTTPSCVECYTGISGDTWESSNENWNQTIILVNISFFVCVLTWMLDSRVFMIIFVEITIVGAEWQSRHHSVENKVAFSVAGTQCVRLSWSGARREKGRAWWPEVDHDMRERGEQSWRWGGRAAEGSVCPHWRREEIGKWFQSMCFKIHMEHLLCAGAMLSVSYGKRNKT